MAETRHVVLGIVTLALPPGTGKNFSLQSGQGTARDSGPGMAAPAEYRTEVQGLGLQGSVFTGTGLKFRVGAWGLRAISINGIVMMATNYCITNHR